MHQEVPTGSPFIYSTSSFQEAHLENPIQNYKLSAFFLHELDESTKIALLFNYQSPKNLEQPPEIVSINFTII